MFKLDCDRNRVHFFHNIQYPLDRAGSHFAQINSGVREFRCQRMCKVNNRLSEKQRVRRSALLVALSTYVVKITSGICTFDSFSVECLFFALDAQLV